MRRSNLDFILRQTGRLLLPLLLPAWCLGKEVPRLGVDPVEQIVKAMTLEEKAALLVGASMENYSGEGSVAGRTLRYIPGSAGTTVPMPQYGIPPTVMADGPAGLRIDPLRKGDLQTYYCTAFPVGTMLASTWNPDLLEEVGAAIGNEVLEYGCDVILGPGMNIHRNPLCGRNFEYYSEDPLLSGKCGAAMVRGIQSQGVGTSIKHFAANNQEGLRLQNDAHVSQRALREIYLRGFEIAVREGKPWTVMSSYNRLNGPYTQENRDLLTTLLRDEWGYDGIVVTDWIGRRNTVAQVHAGNDLMMPGERSQSEEIVRAVREGKLEERDVDLCVRRMLEYVMRTPRFRGHKPSNRPDFVHHVATARKAAAEGMVLLRNEQATLPLAPDTRIALFGVNAYDYIGCGTGAGFVYAPYMTSLDRSFTEAGFRLDSLTERLYTEYRRFGETLFAEQNARLVLGNRYYASENALTEEFIAARVSTNDVAVLSFGRLAGEGNDRPLADFYLSDIERQLLERVCTAFHSAGKRVVVVLNIGGVIETASWRDLPDAILVGWQGGQEGGRATVDVLSGKVSPSGRLPMTFPMDYNDHPSSRNFPINYRSHRGDWADNAPERRIKNLGYTDYEEDIWIGYRYFSSWAPERAAYPFGYGLSYTTFAWSDATVSRSGDACQVQVRVTNTGSRPGKEVVELYVAAPESPLPKPVRELRAFAKSRELAPGQSELLTLRFQTDDLASFDPAANAFVRDAGTYTVELARSADEVQIRLPLKLRSHVRRVHNILNPQQPLHVMTFPAKTQREQCLPD